MTNDQEKIMKEGYRCYYFGWHMWENPYRTEFSGSADLWDAGWKQAEEDDNLAKEGEQ